MFLAFIKKNVPCRPYAPAHQKWSVPRKIGTRWLVYNLKSEQEVRRLLDSARLLAVADKTVTAINKSIVFRYMMKEPSDSFLFGWILHRSNSGGLSWYKGIVLHSPLSRRKNHNHHSPGSFDLSCPQETESKVDGRIKGGGEAHLQLRLL